MFYSGLIVSLWQWIQSADRWLFVLLNRRLANPLFDSVLPYFRDSFFWTPLYLFILVFVVLNYGKRGWWWVLLFVATVAVTDLLGTYALKETIQRIRPCHAPELADRLRLLVKNCSGGYSFPSNHAANHFGLATFMVVTFAPVFRRWMWIAYAWAAAIAFAQVYVGVHYPLDVAGGTALGLLTGYLTASVYQHNFGKLNQPH